MSTLIAVAFPDKHDAEEALLTLKKLEREYLIELEDAVIATLQDNGKVKLKQSVNMTGMGALNGVWWGSLIGLLFGGPLGMLIVGGGGAALGALSGSLTDYGIDDDFIRELSERMEPGHSALFLLASKFTEDKVLDDLRGMRGEVLKTSLSKEDEEKLKEALADTSTGQST